MANVWDTIIQTATKYGVDPVTAVADAIKESGGNPNSVGDGGDSVGLFQLNIRGEGAGMTVAQRANPQTNANIALAQFARVQHSGFHGTQGQLAAAAERPANSAAYAASVDAIRAQLISGMGGPGTVIGGPTGAIAFGGPKGNLNTVAAAVSGHNYSADISGATGYVDTGTPGGSNTFGAPTQASAAAASTDPVSKFLNSLNPLSNVSTQDTIIRGVLIMLGLTLFVIGLSIAFRATGGIVKVVSGVTKTAAVAAA